MESWQSGNLSWYKLFPEMLSQIAGQIAILSYPMVPGKKSWRRGTIFLAKDAAFAVMFPPTETPRAETSDAVYSNKV
jgi:hypothetical protein